MFDWFGTSTKCWWDSFFFFFVSLKLCFPSPLWQLPSLNNEQHTTCKVQSKQLTRYSNLSLSFSPLLSIPFFLFSFCQTINFFYYSDFSVSIISRGSTVERPALPQGSSWFHTQMGGGRGKVSFKFFMFIFVNALLKGARQWQTNHRSPEGRPPVADQPQLSWLLPFNLGRVPPSYYINGIPLCLFSLSYNFPHSSQVSACLNSAHACNA